MESQGASQPVDSQGANWVVRREGGNWATRGFYYMDMGVLEPVPVWNRLYELICYKCVHTFNA